MFSDSERYIIRDGLLIDTNDKILIQIVNSSISTITIHKDITKIGDNAFSHSGIESIKIPSNIEEIGRAAFWNCKELKNIEFEGTLAYLPQNVFGLCSSLTSIKLPIGVKEIRNGAFYRCKSLSNVELNNDLTILREGVFNECDSLVSLNLPESLEIIGDNYKSCILQCPNIEEIYYDAKNAKFSGLPTTLSSIIIGKNVENLPPLLIDSNKKMEIFTIPENVRKVSKSCIIHSNIRELRILSKNIVLEDGWIFDCEKLRKIVLHADMYDQLMPRLPNVKKLIIKKIYKHNILFFKW